MKQYTITTILDVVLYCFRFVFTFCLCPCMAINVSVQYNGRLLPGIILLLTQQCYYHRAIRLNAMKSFFVSLTPMIPPKRSDVFPPDWEMLRRSRCVQIFLETSVTRQSLERHVLVFLQTPDCVLFKEKSERA